jgi:hypothetical protein
VTSIDFAAIAELPARITALEVQLSKVVELLESRGPKSPRRVTIGGLTPIIASPNDPATKARVSRDKELAGLAFRMGRVRVWDVDEVEKLMERRRAERNGSNRRSLRAVR